LIADVNHAGVQEIFAEQRSHQLSSKDEEFLRQVLQEKIGGAKKATIAPHGGRGEPYNKGEDRGGRNEDSKILRKWEGKTTARRDCPLKFSSSRLWGNCPGLSCGRRAFTVSYKNRHGKKGGETEKKKRSGKRARSSAPLEGDDFRRLEGGEILRFTSGRQGDRHCYREKREGIWLNIKNKAFRKKKGLGRRTEMKIGTTCTMGLTEKGDVKWGFDLHRCRRRGGEWELWKRKGPSRPWFLGGGNGKELSKNA